MATNNSSTANSNTAAMAAGGATGAQKKGKLKGKTVDLTEFLNKPINWAEEMEEMPLTPADPDHGAGYGENYTTTIEVRTEIIQKRSQLPTAPKAALSTSVDLSRVPETPPFSAYIGNVSYDAQEDDVERFFKGLRIRNVRLMREGSRVRGYGYVEFETREDLLEALAMDKQRFLNREVKIDLAGRPEEHSQRQTSGYGSSRGGRYQRMGGGYDSDKGRDREQETSGEWRAAARPIGGPPSYDDRRSQPRSDGPPMRQMQPPAYACGPPPSHAPGPPPYGPPQQYGRHPEGYPPQQYPRGQSGYESDYAGGRGGYGSGYETYPMMRQASYSSQHSGYASDRDGGNYRRGMHGPGFYGSMRREHRTSDRYPPPHVGGDRYPSGEGYNAQPYQSGYNQPHYQDDYNRQQRPGGGGGYNRGGPHGQRDQYGYDHQSDQQSYGGERRTEERVSSVDTADGNEASGKTKERPRLALQPRTLPLPAAADGSGQTNGSAEADAPEPASQEQPPVRQEQPPVRPRSSVPSAEVFGGARPVDTSAREREVEEKLRKREEEFRRLEEEKKQQQQSEHPRKSVSSATGPERMSTSGRRRTSDSQCSSGGGSYVKSGSEYAPKEHEDHSGGQMKILQRSRTAPSDVTSDTTADHVSYEQHYDPSYHRQQSSRQSFRAAPAPQNFWAAQNRHRGDDQQGDQKVGTTPAASDKPMIGEGQPQHDRESVADSGEANQSKFDSEHERRQHQDENYGEDDTVFKPQHHQRYPHHGGPRGHRGGRGRGGGQYHYQHDSSTLPPRFARERDQQQFQRRGSAQTDDGQEQHLDRRRASKEIVIRRGGQGTLSPSTGPVRRGAPAGLSGRPQQRPGSRERDYRQKGNDRRQHQRRGSADMNVPASAQEDAQEAQKPPVSTRRSQQPNAPGSRKSSATPAVAADPPPVSFESNNKFSMLNMEDD